MSGSARGGDFGARRALSAAGGRQRTVLGRQRRREPPGDVDPESININELLLRVEETERLWEDLLSEPFDAECVIILDEGAYQAHAGVLVAQALHLGNAHRSRSAPS